MYENACALCIKDLYHIAYLALGDSDKAEKMVIKTCAAGVHTYGDWQETDAIRRNLVADMYRRCKRKLRFYNPSAAALPEVFRNLTRWERLRIAVRFASGLPESESCTIAGQMEK